MLLVKAWCGFAQLMSRSCLTELLVHVICEEILYFGTFLSSFFTDGLDLWPVAGMSTLVCPGLPDTFCHSVCCNTLFSLILVHLPLYILILVTDLTYVTHNDVHVKYFVCHAVALCLSYLQGESFFSQVFP